VVAAVVFETHQWLLLVAVGATIEAGIYAVASWCLLVLRRRDTRERPFRLVAARPLASVGVVLFSVLALASALADPRDAHRLSLLPLAVIGALAGLSTAYVLLVLPRLQAKAAARAAAAARPRRRPVRPDAAPAGERVVEAPAGD
jgi:amino acid transporter